MDKITYRKKIWKNIFGLLPAKQKLRFLWILLILVVSAVLSQLTPLAVGYLTDHVLASQDVSFASVLPVLLLILLVNVANEIIKVARRLIVEDTATQAEKTARQRAAASLLKAPLSYFRGNMTGNIHGRLNRSLEGTVKLIKLLFMDFAPAVTTSLAAVVTIFLRLPLPVAALVILVIPVGTFLVFRQISTQKGIRVELMETRVDMDGTMVELLGGIETIRTLDSAQAEEDRILGRSEQLRRKEMRHHKAMAFYDCLKFINEAVFSVLVIGLSVLLASHKVISIGTVLTAYLCFTQLTGPLRELHRILDEFSECVVLANDYFRLLELPTDFSYLPDASAKPNQTAARNAAAEPNQTAARNAAAEPEQISARNVAEQSTQSAESTISASVQPPKASENDSTIKGRPAKNEDSQNPLVQQSTPAANDMQIRGVCFAYPEKPDQPILSDINLEIPSGAFLGIAGPSGCGKSTLIKVIDKLEQAQGEVLLGDQPLSSLSRAALAENIALVPQTPFLIADTIYNNICYGMKRVVSPEEVKEAAQKANIAADIERFPGKYDFPIAEGGANLSGGQRQRIALARIFLRRPRILILDEATSALDNTSEKLIQSEIEKLKEECGTTVLSIAHRLSTLKNCDEIIVMDKGRIVQKGNYDELEATPGIFRDMALGILK